MIVHHGSNVIVNFPDITHSFARWILGKGFT